MSEFVSLREYQERHLEIEKDLAELHAEVSLVAKAGQENAQNLARLIGSLQAYKVLVPVLTAAIGLLVGLLAGHVAI